MPYKDHEQALHYHRDRIEDLRRGSGVSTRTVPIRSGWSQVVTAR